MTFLQKLREQNPEAALKKRRQYAAAYKAKNPEAVKMQDAAKHKRKKEKMQKDKEYEDSIREQQREANAKYRKKHPEKLKQIKAEWYRKNAESSTERNKKWREDNPDAEFNRNLMKKYGLSREAYEAIVVQQEGVCLICKLPPSGRTRNGEAKRLFVDHCHKTNAVRGLLCRLCNSLLGYARDSEETLQAAILYLEKSKCQSQKT